MAACKTLSSGVPSNMFVMWQDVTSPHTLVRFWSLNLAALLGRRCFRLGGRRDFTLTGTCYYGVVGIVFLSALRYSLYACEQLASAYQKLVTVCSGYAL